MRIDKYYNTCLEPPFTNVPYTLSKEKVSDIKSASVSINNLCLRVLASLNTIFNDYTVKSFPLSERIFASKAPLSPLLWTRFDTFLKEGSSDVFFAEFNYDKPCAEREIMEMEMNYPDSNNVNNNFTFSLITHIRHICSSFKSSGVVGIGFLSASNKYEETCLGYLIKELLDDTDISVTVVGTNNLFVENDELFAFDKSNKIDVLIRLFPTEFLHEVSNINDILDLFDTGKILILNDPRVIAIQCKSLFAYLWDLVNKNDSRLTTDEKYAVKSFLPFTTLTKPVDLISNKSKYIIKPIYGRYSQNVFIGKECSDAVWGTNCKNLDDFIIQEFFPMCKSKVPYKYDKFTTQKTAYGNYGSFLCGTTVIGVCTRWNPSYLTSEDTTWVTPLLTQEDVLSVHSFSIPFDVLYKKSILDFGFAGGFTQDFRYLSTEYLVLPKEKFNELVFATECLCAIFSKVQNLVKTNLDLFADILSIKDYVQAITNTTNIDVYTFFGRLDFVLDINNNLKVLEINSETPAGICESTGVDSLIYSCTEGYTRVNTELERSLLEVLDKLPSTIKTIACVGTNYYEDIYTYNTVREILDRDPLYNVLSGSIYDICFIDGIPTLYGEPIDAIYRYFPLEWIFTDSKLVNLKDAILSNKLIMLNSAESIISQSKGFFALIWELVNSNFFTLEERSSILKYIPYTTFDLDKIISKTPNFFIKPLLEREGNGVVHSSDVTEVPNYDCIFQEQCYIKPLSVSLVDYNGSTSNEELFPILGTYTVDKAFRGIYTRVGDLVTNNRCIYLPTFTSKEENNND